MAFGVVEAIAFSAYVLLGRRLWFWADEWDFLAARTAGDLGDLLRPHGNVHPSTLPILAYRLMWTFWGIDSYRPYQLLIVVAHLICALLVRTVMRRAGVRPWTATVVASLFVLFGAGYQNILWPFQIGFVGAVVFGLAQLLLADHDGPLDQRDWLGLLAGLAAMLCSAVGIAMVVAVGLATFMRRGWRIALFHALPLELLYFLWWTTLARPSYDLARQASSPSPSQILRFMVEGVSGAFRALGQVSGVSILLVVLLLVGLGLAWGRLSRHELRAQAAMPVALPVGAIVFLGLAGFGRAATGAGERGRYVYVVAALLLPALAVAADAVIRRWAALAPLVLAMFAVGIPGNLHAATDYTHAQQATVLLFRRTQLTLPRLSLAQQVPRSHIPQTGPHYYYVTIGWLLDGVASGQIPEPGLVNSAEAATDNLRLSLSRYARPEVAQAYSKECMALHDKQNPAEIDVRLDWGQQMSVDHAVIRLVPASGPAGPAFPLELDAQSGAISTVAIRDGTSFRVQPKFVAATDARVCAPPSAFGHAGEQPPMARNPDVQTFCAAAVDVHDFLAHLSFEGRRFRPEIVQSIHDRLLPLLAKADSSAPNEVAGPVETFTKGVRIGLFTRKDPFGQPAVGDADRTINEYTATTCG